MKHVSKGKVFLIGAGPGDPDLLTCRAVKRLGSADVVVFDRLVSREILALARQGAQLIDVGKMPRHHKVPQEEINALLISLARQGLTVARLKGGDPLIFGRGSEEAAELAEAGIEYEFVPGITSAQGAASSIGFPLTHRGLASSVRYVTGHLAKDAQLDLDWQGLANEDTTLVVYMGAMHIAEIAFNLIRHGMPAALPVMAVSAATTAREKKIISSLGAIATELAINSLDGPVLFVVGHVISLCPGQAVKPARLRKVARYA
ncbi:MAG: uroporphyrinogen-III C-methyltransferase [Rhizobiaceae bacterium]